MNAHTPESAPDLLAELTQARAQVATLEAQVMVLYAALRSEAIVPCGRMPDKGDEPMLVSHRCNVCWTEWELEEPESHKADCPLSALPSSPDINGEMLDALLGIRMFGELGCVQINNSFPGGKKPASKDVWQFPRHLLTGIDEAIARAKSQPSTTGEG